jgi:hypothetical protein
MRLRPRHYILVAAIIAVFVYNIVRNHHRQTISSVPPAPIVHLGPPPQSPSWTAFDHAVDLRDTPDAQFLPALHELNHQIALATDPASTAGLTGCITWLEFYRQGVNHPSRDTTWKDRSTHHLNGCTRYHIDTSA